MNIPLPAFLDAMKIDYNVEKCKRNMIIKNLFMLQDSQTSFFSDTLYIGDHYTGTMSFPEKSYFIIVGKFQNTNQSNVFFSESDNLKNFLNKALKCYYHFQNWDNIFQKYIYSGASMEQILKHCFLIMKNPAYIVDSTFKVLAIDENSLFSSISSIWKHLVEERYLSYDIVYNLKKSNELEDMSMHKNASLCNSEYFNNLFINYNFVSQNRIWGHLFFVGYCKQITPGDLALADYIGEHLLKYFCEMKDPVKTFGKDYENFFIHLLNGTIKDSELIRVQIRPWTWELHDSYLILVFQEKNEGITLYDVLSSKIEQLMSGKSIIWNNHVVAVFHMPDNVQEKELKRKIMEFLNRHKCLGGISDIFHDLSCAVRYYEQAEYALSCGKKLSNKYFFEYKDWVYCHLMEVCSEFCNLDMLVDKRIYDVFKYDRENHSDYVTTLEVYLKNERRLNITASELFIHRNTLAYRLERIRKFLNDDFEDASVRSRLLLSIYILKYGQYGHGPI